MPELVEAPITEHDVNALIEPSVALPAAKFKDLLEYIGHLEDALKCTEFDLGREREFSDFLRSCLTEASDQVLQDNQNVLSQLYENWNTLLTNLIEKGSIGDEQVERFQEVLHRIRSTGGQGAASAAGASYTASESAGAAGEYTVNRNSYETSTAEAAEEAQSSGTSEESNY